MLTHELRYGVSWSYSQRESRDRLYAALQEMFPASAEEKEDKVQSVTESYHKYKREYVKHLSFNPEEENLSKCILEIPIFICFQLLCWNMRH